MGSTEDVKEINAKKIIEAIKSKQLKGARLPCPRCGCDVMDREKVTRNALSRHADVYICDICGIDEAVRSMERDPLPLDEWRAVVNYNENKQALEESCGFGADV